MSISKLKVSNPIIVVNSKEDVKKIFDLGETLSNKTIICNMDNFHHASNGFNAMAYLMAQGRKRNLDFVCISHKNFPMRIEQFCDIEIGVTNEKIY